MDLLRFPLSAIYVQQNFMLVQIHYNQICEVDLLTKSKNILTYQEIILKMDVLYECYLNENKGQPLNLMILLTSSKEILFIQIETKKIVLKISSTETN